MLHEILQQFEAKKTDFEVKYFDEQFQNSDIQMFRALHVGPTT